ncbi:tannase and feruloyl esterase [Mollisia scopiformis]|uniref:Carboxylic ester hydrolase n=1 Tax=Mollisia scopiformis TaxID=149040 RepID=A0A194X7A6_MOLSC|nr:tannase and feruloyl esterase [Mollisia scopiformis]KUJ16051.1 tannase and feruloyl esterase [Mollisia scopiformis]
MAINLFCFLLLSILILIDAAPTSTQSLSERDTQAVTCSNTFMQSTLTKYLTTHPNWTITFNRTAVTETTDAVLASVTPVRTNLCSFSVNVKPSDSTNTFNFELMLPQLSQWNHRFLTLGNSAFSGAINRYHVANGLANGYASMGTDTGHGSSTDQGDESWATNADKRLDWAYRAMDRSIDLAKVMVSAYYGGSTINYSYYSGCSTGGRQGLKQVSVNPESFDGILIGAPAWDEKHLMGWITMITDADYEAGADTLTTADFQLIDSFVMASCQDTQGYPTNDGIIINSNVCNTTLNWNSSLIRCASTGQQNCLDDNKIAVAKKLTFDAYTSYTTNRGGLLFPGYFPGSSLQWGTYLAPPVTLAWSESYEADFLGMGAVTWKNDAQKIVQAIEQPDNWTVSDLSKLNYGGKIILYHGTADGYIPTRSSEYLFNQTGQMFSNSDSWFRYFEIPGMQHCTQDTTGLNPPTGKPAPYYMGGAGQAQSIYSTYVPDSVGINTTQHDGLRALVNWVEQATAPTSLITTAWVENEANYPIYRQRPVCPYPKLPTWNGNNANLATSWTC